MLIKVNLVRRDVSKVFDTGPEIQDYIRINYLLVHLLCQAQVGPGHVGTWEEEMLMSFHFQSWQFLEKWWKMGKRVVQCFLRQNSRISTRNISKMRDIKGVELLIYTDIYCVMVSISVCKACVLTHSHEKGISFTSLIIPLTYNLRRALTSFQSFPKTRLAVISFLALLAFHRTMLYDTISKQKSRHCF